MRRWICVIGLILTVGCTTASVRPYMGAQQTWPMAAGSIVNDRYALPVFTCLPSAPYEVLGELRLQGAFRSQLQETYLPLLIEKARELGANAVLLTDGPQFFAAAAELQQAQANAKVSRHATEVATRVSARGGRGGGGGGIVVMTYTPNTVALAIRWQGDPPSGLTGQYGQLSPSR